MFDVFLSHNSKDKSTVRALAALLSDHGLKVWFDEDQLIPGRRWQPLMEEAIQQSRTGAVLLGADGLGPWQNVEMRAFLKAAVSENKPVIPILLPGVLERPELPEFLSLYTWVDLRDGFGKEGVDKLVWGILGKRPREKHMPLSPSRPDIAVTRLRHGAEHLVGREKELARLDTAWHDPKTHVVTIVARGGVGKTALVVEWMARMARDGWRGAERVFDWSFYSQGTSETTTASSVPFVAKALEFFGDPEMAHNAAPPWDKGGRLAHLVAKHRTLLILDGVEPLQYPPGPKGGQLKDQALEALLKRLVQDNRGLCIVTTREPLIDLDAWMDKTLVYLGEPEQPEDKHPRLCRLSTEAGAQLLFRAGVTKAGNAQIKADDKELKDAAREIDGHALTLQLLGKYLAKGHKRDVRKRSLVSFEKADAKVQGGHAFRMMAAYEKWLTQAGEEGRRQLAVLHLLGLFDRPADAGCITALRQEPVIDGLTEPLVGLDNDDWNLTLSNLAECGLISCRENQSEITNPQPTIDCHPLIREYFAKQLREKRPEAWRKAHRRLYDHLRESTPDKSEPTLDDLQPLCQAVVHGCRAGRANEAWPLYWTRILRHGRQNFLTRVLGAVSLDTAVLLSFFDSDILMLDDEDARLRLRYQLGVDLSSMREVEGAKKHFEEMKKEALGSDRYEDAADACGNLSQEALLCGRFDEALEQAKKSVGYADKSNSTWQRLRRRVTLATVQHNMGLPEAYSMFLEAEKIVPKWREEENRYEEILWGTMDYNFCDLLLDKGRYNEVRDRASRCLKWAKKGGIKMDIGLALLALGRAEFKKIEQKRETIPENVMTHFHDAIRELRNTGRQNEIARGLISRALVRFVNDDTDGCREDLDEAWQIGKRGSMRLHMADALLHGARLFRDKAALAEARKLIGKCGYRRRDGELADAEEAAKRW